MAEHVPIAVVFTKGKGFKKYIKVFKDVRCVDPIIAPRSKKLPSNANIVDIGVGSCFEAKYKKKYKL